MIASLTLSDSSTPGVLDNQFPCLARLFSNTFVGGTSLGCRRDESVMRAEQMRDQRVVTLSVVRFISRSGCLQH